MFVYIIIEIKIHILSYKNRIQFSISPIYNPVADKNKINTFKLICASLNYEACGKYNCQHNKVFS